MSAIRYTIDRDLPVRHEADVIVVGGGPGGLGAAVMSARAGARTVLIERHAALGGMASFGEVHPFMNNHLAGESMDRPVYREWCAAMKHYWPQAKGHHLSKDVAMLAMEDLCREAGVTLVFHHAVADAIVEAGRIKAIVLFSKSGYTAAQAKVYVDCTGDGDLAARAGCAFEFGGPAGFCQPMTLCFKLSHVDKSRVPPGSEIQRLYNDAKAAGEIDCRRENVLRFDWIDDDVVHFNTTRVVKKSAIDGDELSQAEIEARRQVRQFIRFLQGKISGFEQARLHSMAHHIGVRESRRIRGRAYVTRADFQAARKFPDGIARVNYNIDIHSPTGTGTEFLQVPEGDYYEIPYGAVVAADVKNLTVGGRPISGDHATHSSWRVMPPACTIGQAAGVGAALAALRGGDPGDLDGVEVRRTLIEMGAFL
jgi:hypothetical protein